MGNRPQDESRGFRQELWLLVQCGRQVWHLVPWRHRCSLAAGGAVMAITSACNTAIALIIGHMVDGIERGTEAGVGPAALTRTALVFLGVLAIAYMGREVFNVVRRYLVERACTSIDKDLTVGLVAHLMRVDLSTFTEEKIGSLHGRIQRSVMGFVRFLRITFLDFAPAVLTGIFALTATVAKQPWIALAMLGVVPASVILTVRQLMSQKGVRLTLMHSREVMDGTVIEQLHGLEYVRAADTHAHEVGRIDRAAEQRRSEELRHHFEMSLFGCAKALNEGFFHVLVLGTAIYLAIQGSISFGAIITFSMLFLGVMTPLAEIHRVLDEGHECSLQVGKLLELLAEPQDRSFWPGPMTEPDLKDGAPVIVVEDLVVTYGRKKKRRALDGVTLTIRHGETIGVAGRSGSGKTTWLRTLMRLTHPSGGRMLVGGVLIEQVSRESLGRLIGYVGQLPFVFAGTIEENVAYGSPGAKLEDVRRAAKLACIHDEIEAMPGGYQAPVAERGINLSGGQKQRIALARIFLKNPPILVLDEGTSALDNISERRVQLAIEAARADRTVILVAHRLSTMRSADRILVFDGGRIVESGTYRDLFLAGGVFTELAVCATDVASPPKSVAAPEEQAAIPPTVEHPTPLPVNILPPPFGPPVPFGS